MYAAHTCFRLYPQCNQEYERHGGPHGSLIMCIGLYMRFFSSTGFPNPDLHPGSILGPLWGLSGQIHKGAGKWGSGSHPEVFDDEQDYGSDKPEVPGVKPANDVHECLALLRIPC